MRRRTPREHVVRVARAVGAFAALLVLLVFGVPRLIGWVNVPVDEGAAGSAGVPAGSLLVAAPLDDVSRVEVGDVVLVSRDAGDHLLVRRVEATSASAVTVAGPATLDVAPSQVRAQARYHVPLAGAVVAVVPVAHRPWWAAGLAGAFLIWAAAEMIATLRARREQPLGHASQHQTTDSPDDIGAPEHTAPTATPDHARATEQIASVVGPETSPGVETTAVDAAAVSRATRRSRARATRRWWTPVTETSVAAIGAIVRVVRRDGGGDVAGRHSRHRTAQSVSVEALAEAARVQEFEARRIAAEADMAADDPPRAGTNTREAPARTSADDSTSR